MVRCTIFAVYKMRDMTRSTANKTIAKYNKEIKSRYKTIAKYEAINEELRSKSEHTEQEIKDFELNCEIIELNETVICRLSGDIERIENELKNL